MNRVVADGSQFRDGKRQLLVNDALDFAGDRSLWLQSE
jgi:hypothetical protein